MRPSSKRKPTPHAARPCGLVLSRCYAEQVVNARVLRVRHGAIMAFDAPVTAQGSGQGTIPLTTTRQGQSRNFYLTCEQRESRLPPDFLPPMMSNVAIARVGSTPRTGSDLRPLA